VNGLYQGSCQAWDTAEAFLLSDGSWTGTGLTINSGSGWAATLMSPTYALATGNPFRSSTQANFYFTSSATDLSGPFSFDWVLSNYSGIVGGQRRIYTPGAGWSYTDFTATPPWENFTHSPTPPPCCFWPQDYWGFYGCGGNLNANIRKISDKERLMLLRFKTGENYGINRVSS
jgi:hypothetical protein